MSRWTENVLFETKNSFFCPNLSTKSKNKNKTGALPPFGGLEMKLEKIKESKESFEKKKNMMLLFFVFFDDFVKT